MSAELAVQIALRSRFISTAGLTALVPANNIVDRNSRPALDPSIVMGEMQTVDEGDSIARTRFRIYSTLHIWKREPAFSGVRLIAWAMRSAIRPGRLELGAKFHCADCLVSSSRYLRDPDGETAHGVVTVETIVQELP